MGKKNIFKRLNLDRNKLYSWICEFCEEEFDVYDVQELEMVNENNNQFRFVIIGDAKEITLDLYFRNDGTTTLQPQVGTNPDLSLKLASFIIQKVEYKKDTIRNSSYSVKPIEADNVNLLVEYLTTVDGVQLIQNGYNSSNKYNIYQFSGHIGDRITIKYYDNKRLQIQGKPMLLVRQEKLGTSFKVK